MACGSLEEEGLAPAYCCITASSTGPSSQSPGGAANRPLCTVRPGLERRKEGSPKLLEGITSKPRAVLRWLAK